MKNMKKCEIGGIIFPRQNKAIIAMFAGDFEVTFDREEICLLSDANTLCHSNKCLLLIQREAIAV